MERGRGALMKSWMKSDGIENLSFVGIGKRKVRGETYKYCALSTIKNARFESGIKTGSYWY
ncbi:hypothetical protein [Bartonella queenslandensis]|uniref:hypothetical protein n=1 Tax=Bartonella queenslandensis TaxID=481138 RepID=UPI0002D54381|nr:hypothetical protein [Bartonella queenslandensis]